VAAVLCCAVLCCAVLRCAVLRCAVLCCAVLCCAVLCCAVLCCLAPQGAVRRVVGLRASTAWVTPASGVLLLAGGTYTLLGRLLPGV
jgi:hypothetical protein